MQDMMCLLTEFIKPQEAALVIRYDEGCEPWEAEIQDKDGRILENEWGDTPYLALRRLTIRLMNGGLGATRLAIEPKEHQ